MSEVEILLGRPQSLDISLKGQGSGSNISVTEINALIQAQLKIYATKEYVDEAIAQTLISTSVKTFGAIGDGVADDTKAIKSALESEYAQISFEPGQYRITSPIVISNSKVQSIDGCGSIILTQDTISGFSFDTAVSVKNLTFECGNSDLKSALLFTNKNNTDKEIVLSNITIQNVKDTNTTTSSNLISIQGFKSEINQCHFSNCQKLVNGTIGDGGGNLTGIWLKSLDDRAATGRVHNCSFNNISNIDSEGNLAFEDVSCIYVANFSTELEVIDPENTTVIIDNITGNNYGKRLIKTQTNNVHISNIDARAEIDGALSAVSVLGGKNVTIDGVISCGKCVLPIVSLAENTVISNCVVEGNSDMIPENYSDISAGIMIQKKATINNCSIKGMQIGVAVGNTEDIYITNCNWEALSYNLMGRPTCFVFLGSNHGVKNLVVKDNVLNGYRIIVSDAQGAAYNRDNIVLEDNIIHCKEVVSGSNVRIVLHKVNNLIMKNLQFFEGETNNITSRYISLDNCHNIAIDKVRIIETNGSSTNGIVYVANSDGVISIKNVRQTANSHSRLVWLVANKPIESLEIEMAEPKKYRFENCSAEYCPKVIMPPVTVETEEELAVVNVMAHGMLFYILNNAMFKQVNNGAYVNIELPQPNLESYATKEYVNDAIEGIEITGYATEDYVSRAIQEAIGGALNESY